MQIILGGLGRGDRNLTWLRGAPWPLSAACCNAARCWEKCSITLPIKSWGEVWSIPLTTPETSTTVSSLTTPSLKSSKNTSFIALLTIGPLGHRPDDLCCGHVTGPPARWQEWRFLRVFAFCPAHQFLAYSKGNQKSGYRKEIRDPMTSYITHLECTVCGKSYPHEQLIGISPCCEKVLFARYNLDKLGT